MKKINRSVLSISFQDKNLCTRCGTCIGVCPTGALGLDNDFFPAIQPDLCTQCGLCKRTCPGGKVNYLDLTETTFGHRRMAETFDGHVQKTFVGYSDDSSIRKGASGGGVVTGLLWYLLKNKKVDGCIVTRMNPEKPWQGEVFVARNYEQLLSSQQSKYVIIPVNAILQKIRKLRGGYALVALPCQVHGFRKIQKENPRLAKKIKMVIGLFCATSLEPYVTTELLQSKNIDRNDIKNFEYRGGTWPGQIRAIEKNGTCRPLHYANFKDGAINYLTYLYSPPRCQTCIDGSAEFADISVADTWTRDTKGDYKFKGQSRLLVRTNRGAELVNSAIDTGDIMATDVTGDPFYQTHQLHARKKGVTAKIRIKRLARQGVSVTRYDRGIKEATPAQKRLERLETGLMQLARRRSFRLPLITFLTSKLGIPLVKLRQWKKSRKYR